MNPTPEQPLNPLQEHLSDNAATPYVHEQAVRNAQVMAESGGRRKVSAALAATAIAANVVGPMIDDAIQPANPAVHYVESHADIVDPERAPVATEDVAKNEGVLLSANSVESTEIGKDAPPEAVDELTDQIVDAAKQSAKNGYDDVNIVVQNTEITDPNNPVAQDSAVDEMLDGARTSELTRTIDEKVEADPELDEAVDVYQVEEEQKLKPDMDQDLMLELDLVGSDYGLSSAEIIKRYREGTLDEITPGFQLGVTNLIKSREHAAVVIDSATKPFVARDTSEKGN